MKACIRCGDPCRRSPCPRCAPIVERERQGRQWYRAAYASPEYRAAREAIRRRSGGRCEANGPDGRRCLAPATEAHHVVPLARARSLEEAVALCDPGNLLDVCFTHNPRGSV